MDFKSIMLNEREKSQSQEVTHCSISLTEPPQNGRITELGDRLVGVMGIDSGRV